MSNVVIDVENLYKQYRLGVISNNSLQKDFQSWLARMRGKEDPNNKIKLTATGLPLQENNRFLALNDVSFEVKQGEVMGIVGANGAGKSTLLKILSRVTRPTKGAVKIDGRIASLLEVGTGFHPELTGRENVYLNGAILGMSKKEISSKFDEIVAFSEVEKFIDTPVKRYSSGMYVRLAFAVAAHLEPEILIIDEVLAVGDAKFQKKCLGKMESVGREGRTVLFVSHNLAMVRALCTSAILLKNGSLYAKGSVEEICDKYLDLNVDKNAIQGEVEFTEDRSKKGQILKAKLTDNSGHIVTSCDVFDEIYFESTYKLNQAVEGLAYNLVVERNGEILFVSFDTDNSPELLNVRETGTYTTKVKLPCPLKAGKYNIHLSLGILNVDGIDLQRNALQFEVENRSFDTSMCSYTRPGTMAVKLAWDVSKKN